MPRLRPRRVALVAATNMPRGTHSVVGRFTDVSWQTIWTDLDNGRIAEVALVQEHGRDAERRDLWQIRGNRQASIVDVIDLVVRDEVLRRSLDLYRDCLLAETVAHERIAARQTADDRPIQLGRFALDR